jgi:serine/threonine protein kinase
LKNKKSLLIFSQSQKKTVLDTAQGEVLRTNSLVGSIHYLAPEVVSGGTYDVMADWWGFGVLLYDMFVSSFNKSEFFPNLSN